MTFFADHALSARLEHAEATHLALGVETHAALRPEHPSALLRVAGGIAAFLGPTISLSRAVGLGMSGPVAAAELDALTGFYRSRNTAVTILVSAHADRTLFELLAERGYRLVDLDTMLVRPIDPAERFAPAHAGIEVRTATSGEAAAWIRTSLTGFSDTGEPPPPSDKTAVYEALFTMPTSTYLFATAAGAPAGTAAVDVQARTAQLFATSTLPASRGRGAQSALILARLALAQAAGCDLAFLRTSAGSGSQRNAERHGFRPVYSRATMTRALA